MNATFLKTLVIAAGLMLSVGADAQVSRLDTTPPLARMVMNDGLNAGDIILTDMSILGIPNPPRHPTDPPYTVRLSALGCDQIDYYLMENWNSTYPDTNFYDEKVHDQTYFYSNTVSTRSFTVTASDASGIRRVVVFLKERNVITHPSNPLIVLDDGPTEFFNVSPSRAVASFGPAVTGGGNFPHYEKRLVLEPRRTRLPQDAVLHFDLTTFGAAGEINILVEDNAGNTATGSVYLANGSLCRD